MIAFLSLVFAIVVSPFKTKAPAGSLFPSVLNAMAIVQPETIIRWHRAGFRQYWRWKTRSQGERPKVPIEIRRLIREMSLANQLWGAPRIHGAPSERLDDRP